jgi:hypothetical protein
MATATVLAAAATQFCRRAANKTQLCAPLPTARIASTRASCRRECAQLIGREQGSQPGRRCRLARDGSLMLKGSVLYFQTDGPANAASQNNFGNPLPITAFDDGKRTSVNTAQ